MEGLVPLGERSRLLVLSTVIFVMKGFPSKWSVSQHVRNQHAPEASDRRTTEAAQRPTRQWLDSEDLLFLEALKEHGLSSNVASNCKSDWH